MTIERRHLARAHLWLFGANVDPMVLDTTGVTLAQSLAALLQKSHRDGRREAAELYMQSQPMSPADADSGVHRKQSPSCADTGQYNVDELDALLNMTWRT